VKGPLLQAFTNDDNTALLKPIMKVAYNSLSGINTAIMSMQSMFQTGLNCTFMATAYNRLFISFCQNLTPFLAAIALLVVLVSLLSMFAVISITCINRKYYPLQVNTQAPGQPATGTPDPNKKG
jgi:hypothetical protein